MISLFCLIAYIGLARFVVLKIPKYWLKQILALLFGIYLLASMKTGLVPDTFLSAIIVFPGALYLAFLPGRLQAKGK